ncbi:GNAT family N-acetyltransferase [Roseinatronobacter sp. HJB301]|uniref:GNAT family N-acetyltransferase n=2 Tax=Roseinatronobacter alkalisoli TaxID=3028235 RepID=A0ABT5TB34_9RHOB|nr:GNAT family N-acetyltransferase [Roseinatronobacter sp. HJB301]
MSAAYPIDEPRPGRDVPDLLRGKRIETTRLPAPPEYLVGGFQFLSWHKDDAPLYQQMLDDPDLWTYMHEDYPAPMTLELAQDLIALSGQASHHKVRAVYWQDQLVGQARLQWATGATPPASGEISYWLARKHWGKGLAAPMVGVFAHRCFTKFPGLQQIEARIHRDNSASLRLVEKLGFLRAPQAPETPDWGRFILRRGTGLDWSALAFPRL